MAAKKLQGLGLSRKIRMVGIVSCCCVMGYLFASAVVFDFTSPALLHDNENLPDGTPVAIGPRPRWFACRPAVHGVFYGGEEFVFWVFQPVCEMWCVVNGYAKRH